ncbi:glycosyltransferase family 4 protein [Aeromicrobium wangtongii]|uniref:Glycosyltransferase family 4 protein n=1 Tax=Aeromicrobium wangtongii TaxID=2969247 RepID=A0ABY5MDN4_9ACTN|nr:glycosyltransferase family 4 protein [Aeromicrobium wangtongii]MCD9199578.1 glycosyltransferase family 4 protein [Aeromicrobium wangtongii]UUP13931.1 glycosyltransferase family 4 protein [Aeromicrobium wangtongii]
MRIAVVNNFYPPRPGGSSHLSDHLARRYAAAGHEVLVITATYQDALREEVSEGLRIVRVPAWTLPKSRFAANFDIGFTLSPGVRRQVFGLLDDFQPDVIHQHGQFFDLTWLSGWWARRRGVPTLLSIHTRLESPLSRFNSLIYALADRMLVWPMMKLHKPRLVIMDRLMDAYVRARYRGAHSDTVAIPVGIDPTTMEGGQRSVVREELGLGDRPTIVSVGHVIPQRSRIALARALPEILRAVPDLAVVVVGGLYHEEFLEIAEELGVRSSIITVGAQPQRSIPDYLAAADVEVHELEGEGFGTASLEALAVGTPVVARVETENFIGLHLVDGVHIFQTPPVSRSDPKADPAALAATLIAVLSDPAAARAKVSDNARGLIAGHFTIDAVAARHLEVLGEMAGIEAPVS